MQEIVVTIILIAFVAFTITIMGLGVYVVYKIIKDF